MEILRFQECPKCGGKDIDRDRTLWIWFCYDCGWEEPINEEEKKED